MKPSTILRTVAMSMLGVGMFLFDAASVSALSDASVSATSWLNDGKVGRSRSFNESSLFAKVLNGSALALPNGMTGERSEDTAPPDLFAADLDRAFRQFQFHGTQGDAGFEPPLQIHVVFHVISGPLLEGNVSESSLIDQISVLNNAYRSLGLHFNISQVRRYPDSPYFLGGCFPTTKEGMQMKAELAVDPARNVNIYICTLLFPLIVGYGTFPNQFPEADPQHGIVIDYRTLPGSAPPLDLGYTLVHELGHYFGLLHTFQGGCEEPGDGISDTPAEAFPAYGCEMGRDTCPQAGLDPVSNFMDYSADTCMDRFTPVQNARMQALISTFRPSLVGSAFSIGPGISGNWYNSSESGHGFSIEVLPGNLMLVQWFVFAPNGGQIWIIATGPITGNTAVLQGYQVVGAGARFPPNFNPAQIQSQPWGTLTFLFTDCNHGQASWQPVVAGYTSGSMPIARVTMPAGLTCP